MAVEPKVIGIGFSKTGTTSLRECFEEFHLDYIGFDPGLTKEVVSGSFSNAIDALDNFEAAANWPWPLIYREIDVAYPLSKFVLTVRRDSATWLKSLLNQAQKKPRSPYRELVYGSRDLVGHEEALVSQYEAHNSAVRLYFANRPQQLLEVCWDTGDGWRELCGFLGRSIPSKPFPRANPSARDRESKELGLRSLYGREPD